MFGKGVLLVLLVLGTIAYQAQAWPCKYQYCIASHRCVILLFDGYIIYLLNSKGESDVNLYYF